MFTGIVSDIGTIVSVEARGDLRAHIRCGYDLSGVTIGASIACSGACLTVVAKAEDRFAADISAETVSRTASGRWVEGATLNLERALRLGDELGGHIVTGHVDGIGSLIAREHEGDSLRLTIAAPRDLAPFIAAKGSITLDGVSLTVAAALENGDFQVAIIPHTWEVTTLGALKPGSKVNLEVDMLARYVARMIGADAPGGTPNG